ncbi:hypothetical protein [Acinetobacter seifertii]|uniref:hypothetical protein n=1 Tax=Acinetobacter seifertii TaxID=1530123 RepID=UPI000D349828|nr:hypothetical protein [Acinetobacter seifertii]PTV53662.1 hypothetical protein DBL04_10495 [Acinetobacter seifertii]
MRKVIACLVFSIISTYGCTKANTQNTKIKVNNCSYSDEYFNYCKENYLKQYENLWKNSPVNFNKKYILTSIGGGKDSYAGIVAINKENGQVDTMLFGYKKNSKSQIETNINSDSFCILGEVNSKSYDITQTGKSCFKFNHNGFDLLKNNNKETNQNESVFPITFNNNKLLCNQKKCNQIRLTNLALGKISLDDQDTSLDMMVYERGNDTTYIDASDNNYNLYLMEYTVGDAEQKNFLVAYMKQGKFISKNLGAAKNIKILNSRDVIYDNKKVNFE